MRITKLAAALLALVLIVGSVSPPASANADVSFGFFYSDLSPHGNWLISGSYGRVWQPRVYSADWNPYYDGRWVYSDCGWTWVSDYAWGDVPYHYGTWTVDPALGWVWVPGYVWAPSWVVFRTGPDYIGWAPVSPSFSVGVSVGSYDYDPDLFVFVGAGDFLAPRIRTYVVPVSRSRTFLQSTTVVNHIRIENNVVVNQGPDLRLIEQATGTKVKPQPIERVAKFAPVGRESRAAIRVDSAKAQRGLRVAEPVSAKQELPGTERTSRTGRTEAPTLRSTKASVDPTAAPSRANTQESVDAKVKAARARADAQAKADAKAKADARAKAERQAQAEAKAKAKTAKKGKAKKGNGVDEAQAEPGKKKDDRSG